jgi:hypothetical protein
MMEANEILIEALLDDVLDESILNDGIREAQLLIEGDNPSDRIQRLDAEIARVERERARLVSAVAAGGN